LADKERQQWRPGQNFKGTDRQRKKTKVEEMKKEKLRLGRQVLATVEAKAKFQEKNKGRKNEKIQTQTWSTRSGNSGGQGKISKRSDSSSSFKENVNLREIIHTPGRQRAVTVEAKAKFQKGPTLPPPAPLMAETFSSLHYTPTARVVGTRFDYSGCVGIRHYNALQHTATHCNTLQHTAV